MLNFPWNSGTWNYEDSAETFWKLLFIECLQCASPSVLQILSNELINEWANEQCYRVIIDIYILSMRKLRLREAIKNYLFDKCWK